MSERRRQGPIGLLIEKYRMDRRGTYGLIALAILSAILAWMCSGVIAITH